MAAAEQSLLERMIGRLTMQRACLDLAASMIAGLPGPVLEIGLGKGRTYDHLRRLLPDRVIYAFDRDLHAPLGARPDVGHIVLGDFFHTLPRMRETLAGSGALAHADFGTDDAEADAAQARWLGPLIDRLLAPGAVVLSDRPLEVAHWLPLPVPPGDWPYHLWRVGEAAGS